MFLNVSSNILVVIFRVNIFEEFSSPLLLTKWFLKILFRHLLFLTRNVWNNFHHLFFRTSPDRQSIFHRPFSLIAWSIPARGYLAPLFRAIVASLATHYLLRDLYNCFQNIAKALIIKMATVVFVETLENYQHPKRRIPENRSYILNSSHENPKTNESCRYFQM
jgi:hypothetical protein